MPPRVMNPNGREMDQLETSQREGDSEPQETVVSLELLQEMLSSLTVEEIEMLPGLMQRAHECRRAREEAQEQIVEAPQVSNGLQDVLDEVADQVPDDEESSDEDAPSSTSRIEECGVCERSFRHREPVVTCVGCTKSVHNQYCVKNVRLGTAFQTCMCHTC